MFNFYTGNQSGSKLEKSQKNSEGENSANNFNQTTIYKHPLWGPEKEPIPLFQRHSIGMMVDEILTANRNNQYTGILEIGKSGSGKTTLTQTLVHRLHEKENYVIKWFEKKDIQNFVKIVKGLPHTPHILIFQDASYALNGLTDEEIEEIAAQLTFIRHNTRAKMIVIIQIHYSKAIEKFFRDTDITICTSITDNERTNIMGLFGSHNSYKINTFIRIYHNQTFRGFFQFKTSSWTQQALTYKTNDPFRAALVSSVGECHYLLYPREECAACSLTKQSYTTLSAPEVIKAIVDSVGPTIARASIRSYMFFVKGRKVLPSNSARGINLLAEMDHNAAIDWNEVYDLTQKELKRKTGYRFTKKHTIVMKEIRDKISKKFEDPIKEQNSTTDSETIQEPETNSDDSEFEETDETEEF